MPDATEQIVGRERRERVSQLSWSGDACVIARPRQLNRWASQDRAPRWLGQTRGLRGQMLRLILSIPCGGVINVVLLVIAFKSRSETIVCILLWNYCLLMAMFKPGLHSHPLIVLVFLFSAVPVYSLIAYYVLGKLKIPGI